MTGQMIRLAGAVAVPGMSPELTAYVTSPPGLGPRGGVVVLHEAFGLDAQCKRHADRLATMGYAVVAPDLFTAGPRVRCLLAAFRALRSGQGRVYADIAAARRWLLGRADSNGQVGVVGFCLGGGFALMTAAGHGFDVSAPNYGMLPQSPEQLAGACPIVASYGGLDRGLAGSAAKLDGALTRLGVEHDVREYPSAGHAFLNDSDNAPWFLRPILKTTGGGPDPGSAALAWPRIEAFLARHLA